MGTRPPISSLGQDQDLKGSSLNQDQDFGGGETELRLRHKKKSVLRPLIEREINLFTFTFTVNIQK